MHISKTSDTFIKMILQELKPEYIVSIRLNTVDQQSNTNLVRLAKLTEIVSLTLLNLKHIDRINQYQPLFPKLIRLCLCYNNEVDFFILSNIFNRLSYSIKRFEIRCAASSCTHLSSIYQRDSNSMRNDTIEYFLLDACYFPRHSIDDCYQRYASCLLMTTIDFMKIMRHIRHVHIILNRYNLENMLDDAQWKSLIQLRDRLTKVTLQVTGTMIQDEQLKQKVLAIQSQLHSFRSTVQFKVISM